MPQAPVPHIEGEFVGNPICKSCGVAMKLYGIELHPNLSRTDLWTFVCFGCDEVQTAAVSNAAESVVH